jgi:ADP-ribose pyrophosphatase YjhB (NUDIX family)
MAIIGGIIEPGESPDLAAALAVEEEMHAKCDQMHRLGRYRTDVNRGMGWVSSYLATHCQPVKGNIIKENGNKDVGTEDVNRQDL